MTDKLILHTSVSYGDVDRGELMLLPRVFKLLQEAAITHANQFGVGTRAAETRGETWLLNRIAAGIERYPRHDERLRVETWSNGIKGFKGVREFRVFDASEHLVIGATSVWLYLDVKSKSLVRVPRDIAEGFPSRADGVWFPELEKARFEIPDASAVAIPISLRYSDFDVNEHMNNAAYFDLLQTALVRTGGPARPQRVQLHFGKAIPAAMERVTVRLASHAATTCFSIEESGVVFAQGEVTV